jgi:hypothetical protein
LGVAFPAISCQLLMDDRYGFVTCWAQFSDIIGEF